MKKTAFAVAALAALTVSVLPVAHADGDQAGAAALGFVLGTLLSPTTVVYGAPPAGAYGQGARVVVRVPDRAYDGYRQTPHNHYYRVRQYDRRDWRNQGRSWMRHDWAGRGDWNAYRGHDRRREGDD